MLDGPPIKMAVLSKPNNAWVASESADDQEAGHFIASIEDRIGARFSTFQRVMMLSAPPPPLPDSHLRLSCRARREMKLHVEYRQHKGLNNRAENSHQPTRRREWIMKRFKSRRQAQSFLSTDDQVANLFHIPYSEHTTANARRALRERALGMWKQYFQGEPRSMISTLEICQAFLQLRGVKLRCRRRNLLRRLFDEHGTRPQRIGQALGPLSAGSHDVDGRRRGDVVVGRQIERRLRQPVKLDGSRHA